MRTLDGKPRGYEFDPPPAGSTATAVGALVWLAAYGQQRRIAGVQIRKMPDVKAIPKSTAAASAARTQADSLGSAPTPVSRKHATYAASQTRAPTAVAVEPAGGGSNS